MRRVELANASTGSCASAAGTVERVEESSVCPKSLVPLLVPFDVN